MSSMRVLFTTQPGLGHLVPLLPIAAGLRQRGHDVAVASSASFGRDIIAAGFRAVAVGRDWLTTEMATAFPEVTALPPGPERYAWGRTTVFARRTALEAVPDLIAAAAEWRPDLVVRDAAEYAGCLAAELLDVPHAVVRTDSGSSSYARRHDVADSLTELRRHFGLPPDPNVDMPFRFLQLSFAPPGLDGATEDAAPTCHRFRPVEPPTDELGPPTWLATLPARPTVYATLGTVYNAPALLAIILDGLVDEPLNLIMTVGPGQDPAVFGDQPHHVRIERWIPQHVVLPRCDAVVTHGGYGTVAAALSAGRPLVFMPISADQPLNAARCAALGVAEVIEPDGRTPAAVRSATRSVLDDGSHRRAARRVARASRRRPGLDRALDLLEELARDRVPLTEPSGAA